MLKTVILTLSLFHIRGWWWRMRNFFRPKILMADVASDCVKVESWIVNPLRGYIAHLELDPAQRFVGQFFCLPATIMRKDFYKAATNLFVTPSSLFSVTVEPIE